MTQRAPGGPSGPVMPGLGPSGWAPPTPQLSPGPPPGIRPPAPPRRWLSILLVGVPAAFIVAVFAAVTIVPFLLRWESFIVTSASMTPSIPVGSVVVVDPSVAQKMQVGDIGTFNQVESQMRVTHRVIEVQGPEGPNRVYITKGDATRTTDGPRAANTAIGKVQYTVPWVGYIATSVNEPQIRYPLIGLIVVLIGISYFRSRRQGVAIQVAPAGAYAAGQMPFPQANGMAGYAQPGFGQQPGMGQPANPFAPQGQPGFPGANGAPAGWVQANTAGFGTGAPVGMPGPKTPPKRRAIDRVTDIVVIGIGVVAVLLAALVFIPLAVDLRPIPVGDSTMAPGIPYGALVFAERAQVQSLEIGDLIVYAPAQEQGKVYVRRVATLDKTGATPADYKMTPKADQLPGPDNYTIAGNQTVGKVKFSVPVAGLILGAAGRREGLIFFGALILLLVVVRQMRRPKPVPVMYMPQVG